MAMRIYHIDINLWRRTLSKKSCLRSGSSSGLTPWHNNLNITGSGFSFIQQTKASSYDLGTLGYAQIVKSWN